MQAKPPLLKLCRTYLLILMWFTIALPVLARQGELPRSWVLQNVRPATAIAAHQLPAVDAGRLLAEDEAVKGTGPLRFATAVTMLISPANVGSWETLSDGARLWRYRFHSPGATDLNFGFSRFRLPPGASLYIYSESTTHRNYYQGPYTAADSKPHGQLWTPVVPGDSAAIELYLPPDYEQEPDLLLSQVGTGYRDMFGSNPLLKQGSCNNDVICPVGDPWRDEIQSVARYTVEGFLLCTGTMIMDVPGSFRPFFLTANHCTVNPANAASMVAYWNYESPVCGQLSGGSLNDNQTGATFLAAEVAVDFALVELAQRPDEAFNVFYSGWDRSNTTPQGSVGIHHPNGDEKAISFNTDPLTTGPSCINGTPDTHWYVDNWEDGTTEAGSSGSGLWDPANKRLVGFLTGGFASCSVIDFDCYGKFSVAWNGGGTAAERLMDWLDPGNSGALSVAGAYPSAAIPIPAISIPTLNWIGLLLLAGGLARLLIRFKGRK